MNTQRLSISEARVFTFLSSDHKQKVKPGCTVKAVYTSAKRRHTHYEVSDILTVFVAKIWLAKKKKNVKSTWFS